MQIDCISISNKIKEELKQKVELMDKKPELNIIQVGNRPDSTSYIKNKEKVCNEIGIICKIFNLNEDIKEEELLLVMDTFLKNNQIFFVQLPLPDHINEERILSIINPKYDVDGLTDLSAGKILHNKKSFIPCTPKGILTVLENITELEYKKVLIINRSNHIGKPLSMLLLDKDCTVTIAHSKTKHLKDIMDEYDIIISAIGKPKYFNDKDLIKGQIFIDVSINLDENNKLCGDLDKDCYDKLDEKNVLYTTVPKGIGPMTVISLMEQIVNSKDINNHIL